MKIAILTSGILPVPAVQGGAAENLIDYFLEYNALHRLHDMTVFSVYHSAACGHPALQSDVNHYVYVDRYSRWARLRAKLYGYLHKNEYYHYQLEYFFEQAYKQLRRQSYDLIILENRPGYALKLSQRLATPIVAHIHTDLVNPQTAQVEAIVKDINVFICVSEYLKSRVLSVGLPTKAIVVYNGLDEKRFTSPLSHGTLSVGGAQPFSNSQILDRISVCGAQPFSNSQILDCPSRQSFGLDDNDFVVIYTGRIVPDKGVKELVQAVQLLRDHPDVKLLVVGGDNYADSVSSNPYLDELHEMGRQMQGKVHFTGFVPYDKLPLYLCLANVAVVPSRINEALGMTCIEATAMGLPVIATNDGGIPETLVGQKHILIDKDGDLPRQIADAILKVKANSESFVGNTLSDRFKKDVYAKSFFSALDEFKPLT